MTGRRETEREGVRSVVLVLGLGNPLRGDDGVGPRVVAELEDQELPEGVEVMDGGTGGLDLLQIMEGRDRVVIVDAAQVGGEHPGVAPGQFVRFSPDQAHLAGGAGGSPADCFSSHHAGLAEVLALAHALEQPLPSIVVFGVQPKHVGWGEGLSPEVESQLPGLILAVLEEVNEPGAAV